MNPVTNCTEAERPCLVRSSSTSIGLSASISMNSLSESEIAHELKSKIEKLTVQAEEWSECTAEWQKKWERMRSKREKAIKEANAYREKVDSLTRQLFLWKEKYLQIEKENDRLKTQLKVLSPDGALLMSKSPSPGEVGLAHHKGSTSSAVPNGHHVDAVFDNGCGASRKSDEGFDSASENLSPAQSVDLHTAFSLQPQLKLIEALMHRNENTQTRKSSSNSRSPSPARPLSDSQRDELVTLRQKCEDLEKQLQEERKLRLVSQATANEAHQTRSYSMSGYSSGTQSLQRPYAYTSQIPPLSFGTSRPLNSSTGISPRMMNNKRTSLKVGSKVTHEYITKHGKECFEEVLL